MEDNPAEELYWLSRAAAKQGERSQTREEIERALILDPKNAEALALRTKIPGPKL